MQRTGRKHQPTYRLVLTDSTSSAKSGKYLELLGNYDSRNAEKAEIKSDRVSYWISVGAQVSPTVHNLLVERKIIAGKKVNKLPLKKAIVKEIVETATVPVAEPAVAEETAPVTEEKVESAEVVA